MKAEDTSTIEQTFFDRVGRLIASGSGLAEVTRVLARELKVSMLVLDQRGVIVAASARSHAEERELAEKIVDAQEIKLELNDQEVGALRVRPGLNEEMVGITAVKALLALELQRLHASEELSSEAATRLLVAIAERELTGGQEIREEFGALGIQLENGGVFLALRAHPLAPTEDDWRKRLLLLAERGVRSTSTRALAALVERPHGRGPEVIALLPEADQAIAERAAHSVLRELEENLNGFVFAVGCSRATSDIDELTRASSEARLAANVVEADGEAKFMSFDDTGAYRLLLPAISDNPAELESFYQETISPIVAYDEQYETELVRTLDTFLDTDGNIAGSAQKLYTHRHTVRYRLERVRELTGLDVSSSDGREKLSLGLKAMHALGITTTSGPAAKESVN